MWRPRPKILHCVPLFTSLQDAVDEFRQEMALMMQLRHPNLVGLLHVITQQEPHALVLEYMSNGALADWLKRTPLAPDTDLLLVLHQVACGMAALEARGIGKWRAAGKHISVLIFLSIFIISISPPRLGCTQRAAGRQPASQSFRLRPITHDENGRG